MLKDKLKELREKHGLTKRELCEKTGISERAYLTYEFGEREPKVGTISILADFYGVSVDYILDRTEEKLEPLDALAKEKNMHIIEKTMLEMYFKLGAERRADFIEAMINVIQSSDDPKDQVEIKVKRAARNGFKPSEEVMTESEANEIRSRPDADPDL